MARGVTFNSRKQYVNEEGTLVSKKNIVFMMLFVFVLGLTSANAADIKAVKVSGAIPVKADDPFWTRYGPTFHKHTVVDLSLIHI